MHDELIHGLFPHRDAHDRPSYRHHQFEVIRDVLAALNDPSVVDVVVEAPTGAGKTSIAVTVARVLTRDFASHRARAHGIFADSDKALAYLADYQVHMITSMKMLQDAYLGDDSEIRLVKGKNNYHCHRDTKQTRLLNSSGQTLNCDDAEQLFGRLCEHDCPYRQAREDGQWAAITLHNFDGFLYQATLGQAFGPRRLLTVDEAHNCEEKVRSFMTMSFNPRVFKSLGLPWVPLSDFNDMNVVKKWARDCLDRIVERMKGLGEELAAFRKIPRSQQRIEDLMQMSKIAKGVRKLSRLGSQLERFCFSVDPDKIRKPANWVAYVDHENNLVLEPVDAGRFVPNALLKFGRQRLHLSATFLNGRGAYSKSVNISSAAMKMVSVPSTFPAEHRPIVPVSSGDLGARGWEENLASAVDDLSLILDDNAGVRGVVHCTSYDMSEQLAKALGSPRLLTYDRETRDKVVGAFVTGQTDDDAVLMAVALNEGYDFKDDLCRFQVIVRVPYIVPTKCVKARMKNDDRFYGWRTALSLVQAYGRGTRSAEDWCHTYVLDNRFAKFVEQEQRQLPTWFLEAIK